jgi:hypothetical protein
MPLKAAVIEVFTEQFSPQAQPLRCTGQFQGHEVGVGACHVAELAERSRDAGAVAGELALANLVEHPGADRLARVGVGLNFEAGTQLLGGHIGVAAWLHKAGMRAVVRPRPSFACVPGVAKVVVAHGCPAWRRWVVLAAAPELDHWYQVMEVDAAVLVAVLDDQPVVLIALEAWEGDALQVVDVLVDLGIGWCIAGLKRQRRGCCIGRWRCEKPRQGVKSRR